MPTIKRKVEMNLPQLIEWGWENVDKVEGKKFKSNVKDVFGNYSIVQFSFEGYLFKTDGVGHKDTFTVEVEESITENTEFELMIEIADGYQYLCERESVEAWKDEGSKEFHAYIDGEFKLIWKNGRLVE